MKIINPAPGVPCKASQDKGCRGLGTVPGARPVMVASSCGGCHGVYFYLSFSVSAPRPASSLPGGRLNLKARSCN